MSKNFTYNKDKITQVIIVSAVALMTSTASQAAINASSDIKNQTSLQTQQEELWNSNGEIKYNASAIVGGVKAAVQVGVAVAKAAAPVIKAATTVVKAGAKIAEVAHKAVDTASKITTQLAETKAQVANIVKAEGFKGDRDFVVAKLGGLSQREILYFTADMDGNTGPQTAGNLETLNETARTQAKEAAEAEQKYMLNLEMKQILDKRLADAVNKVANDENVDFNPLTDGLEEEAKANLAKLKPQLRDRPNHDPKIVSPDKLKAAAAKEAEAATSLTATVQANEKLIGSLEKVSTNKEENKPIDDIMPELTTDVDKYVAEAADDERFEKELLEEEDFGDLFYGEGDINVGA